MDIFAILGCVIGVGFILTAQAMEGGNVTQLMQPTAAMIVLGGTAGAIVGSFPPGDLKEAIEALKEVGAPVDLTVKSTTTASVEEHVDQESL